MEILSTVLKLTNTPESLRFPIAVKSMIWRHRIDEGFIVDERYYTVQDLASTHLSEPDSLAISNWIVEQMPWLFRYALKSQMAYDVHRLGLLMRTPALPG
jgi:hypothetical protein